MANSSATAYSHWFKLKRPSLFYRYYMYIDTPEYLADQLLIKHEVTVKFMHEFVREGTPYLIIHCKIRRKDEERFLTALAELPDKMLLCGHTDYIAFCTLMMERIKHDKGRGQIHE